MLKLRREFTTVLQDYILEIIKSILQNNLSGLFMMTFAMFFSCLSFEFVSIIRLFVLTYDCFNQSVFDRVLELTKALYRCPDEEAAEPETLMKLAESIISEKWSSGDVKQYFIDQVLRYIKDMTTSISRSWNKFGITKNTPAIYKEPWRQTKTQLREFLKTCHKKYLRAKV